MTKIHFVHLHLKINSIIYSLTYTCAPEIDMDYVHVIICVITFSRELSLKCM